MSAPDGRVQFLIYALVTRLARGNPAAFAKGRRGYYRHSRRRPAAQSDVDVARLLADHLKRGVRRNRRTQRIDVASEISHDGAAEQLNVCATYERNAASACGLLLGGLGLRSHTNRGANHRSNRNCSTDCHVVPPWLGPLPTGSQVKQVRSMLCNRSRLPLASLPAHCAGPTLYRSRVRFGSQADMCSAQGDVRFVPIADIAPFIRSPRRQAAETTRVPRGQAPWPFED